MIYVIPIIAIAILFFVILAICFFMAFYSPKKSRKAEIPKGKVYEEWRDTLVSFMNEMNSLPCREIEITSHDGLKLSGKYFEYSPDAPIELMVHGYRSCAEVDLAGGVVRARRLGHSCLLINNRGAGTSEGHVITFGVKESLDIPMWVDYIIKNINPDAKIILTGISMGAASVMLASALPLPENVIGVLADCGYSRASDIIKKVIGDMKLPLILYPFVRLSGRLFGGFDTEDADCIRAIEKTSLPVIFFHGDADDFVPSYMSRECFDACNSRKRLVIIKGAGHGLAYPVAPEKYLEELDSFFAVEVKR